MSFGLVKKSQNDTLKIIQKQFLYTIGLTSYL